MPSSYISPFSQELTPKRILACMDANAAKAATRSSDHLASSTRLGDLTTDDAIPVGAYYAYLRNETRLCDCGLVEGDHVWIDVGDGDLPSQVHSRTFGQRPEGLDPDERIGVPLLGYERIIRNDMPNPNAITGEECLLAANDRQPDRNPTVEYYQVRRAPAILTLEDWCAKQQRRRDGPKPGDESTEAEGTGGESGGEDTQLEMTYDDFHTCFELMGLSDMVGYKTWQSDAQVSRRRTHQPSHHSTHHSPLTTHHSPLTTPSICTGRPVALF